MSDKLVHEEVAPVELTEQHDTSAAMPGGETFCGVAAAVAVLGDAWTLLLVRDLADAPRRFTALQASTGISPRVLTDRLHKMMHEGLVTREIYPEIPPRVEYTLTAKGRDAVGVISSLRDYGEKWLRPSVTMAGERHTPSAKNA
jgi:DNA-binding HxlR family transcriptional regulator